MGLGKGLHSWKFWRACLALFFAMLFSSLLDYSSIPNSAGHLAQVTILPRLVGSLAMLVATGVFLLRPQGPFAKGMKTAFDLAALIGVACFAVGAATGNTALIAASAWLMAIGSTWVAVAAYASVTGLRQQEMPFAIVLGFALSALAGVALDAAPLLAKTICLVASAPASLWLSARDTTPLLEYAAPMRELRRDPGLGRLLGSICRLLVFVLLYEALYGFLLNAGSLTGTAFTPAPGLVPTAVLLALLAFRKGEFPYAATLMASILLAIAGFLIGPQQLAGAALAGSTCTAMSIFLFVVGVRTCFCAIGHRFPAVQATLYTASMGIAGIGVVAGSLLGRLYVRTLSTDPALAVLITSAIVIVFCVACTLAFTSRGIASMLEEGDARESGEPKARATEAAQSAEGDRPGERRAGSPPGTSAADAPVPASAGAQTTFAVIVETLAQEHGLSARETEVFSLLARGRNREHIQGRLVVSKDTAKAHIKHVYAKLGVHSQQELIDLVEHRLEHEWTQRQHCPR